MIERNLNPFVQLKRTLTPLKFLELAVGAYCLLPIRLLAIALGVLACYIFARMGLSRRGEKDENPIQGWRKTIAVNGISFMTRIAMFICGFYYLKAKGPNPAPAYEAPVYIAAPRTSFLDEIVPLLIRVSPVSSQRKKDRPILGVVSRAMMTLFHKGESFDTEMLAELKQRASVAGWLPIMIFPEEVHTNGRSLIHFPIDLFQLMKPVQPVLVKFSHSTHINPMQPSWTVWNVLSFLCSLKHTLTIEYLDVIYPDKENEENFVKRVRGQMAHALSINTSLHSREDLELMKHARELGLPPLSGAVEFMSLRKTHDDLTLGIAMKELNRFSQIDRQSKGVITQADLAYYLKESPSDIACFFKKYKLDSNGDLTFKSFLEGHLEQAHCSVSPQGSWEQGVRMMRSRPNNLLLQRHTLSSCENDVFSPEAGKI